MKIKKLLQALGPGLLFAGAAIGVSHLVNATHAGAEYGWGLLWALVIVHIVKYPFFEFGARYANATGESLLEGYAKIHRGTLVGFFIINLLSMFTIQAAVTLVTAGLAMNIFGIEGSPMLVSTVLTIATFSILLIGKYSLLDKIMKYVIILLTLTTLAALATATCTSTNTQDFSQKLLFEGSEIAFLIAFLGWMPAPLDVSIWQSLWSEAKQKQSTKPRSLQTTVFDFNIGYITTLVLGACFLGMGAMVMFHSNEPLASGALGFCKQLIEIYTKNIGSGAFIFIAVASFTTMFSTNITAMDASPRAMQKTMALLTNKTKKSSYVLWLVFLGLGTLLIISFFTQHMLALIKVATIISFLAAPFFAILNYKLVNSSHTPESHKPSKLLNGGAIFGIVFLIAFSIWYLITLI
ncbi:divalent metal cation transporter [Flavobacteriaceae bacterium]|nr:divalent metal cation transporter [Flavobacteriaceae bacterium]